MYLFIQIRSKNYMKQHNHLRIPNKKLNYSIMDDLNRNKITNKQKTLILATIIKRVNQNKSIKVIYFR